ncbi:MAG: 4-hydroxy-tetrahydrodipicolinate reductase [Oscillospiraceae bacterium]|nr:4-hydroxy-tetrahydrodipicolinate reductase [Oscillospiraceae bacterium]
MLNILLSGCNGRLSRAVIDYAETRDDVQIVAGIDPCAPAKSVAFPVFASPALVTVQADVIVDCSLPCALPALLDYAVAKKIPAVIATTGYTAEELAVLDDAAKHIPVLQSGNMSLGIHLLKELARQAAQVLGEAFDIEIIEAHHNQKLDAPSGTAFILADAVNKGLDSPRELVHERESRREVRPREEIGMHAIRGGTITGEHTVLFAGFDEVVELTHKAHSKAIFAAGCISAARFMASKQPGRYTMNDIVNPCCE